jgi:hypothetical protein
VNRYLAYRFYFSSHVGEEETMSSKLRMAIFKVIDILVILTMVSASPLSITATALAQEASPTLVTDKADYATGETARLSGSDFPAGDYLLTGNGVDWGTVTADESGVFVTDSPAFDAAGNYEVQALAAADGTLITSVSFTVSEPPQPTEVATEVPTEAPTTEPTQEPTEEPTVEPTAVPTEEPTAEPTQEPTVEPTPVGPPYIQSDKADYAPGELVTLTGGNWQGDTQVRIVVNDDAGETWRRDVTVAVAADGSIVDQFNLPTWFVANYSVRATGQQTGRVAVTSFTDLSIGTYDQCSNDDGDGYSGNPGLCDWINGNLNGSNSTYFEGDATVQRLWLTDFAPGSSHTVTLKYGTTKGGKHAYDFLTNWDWSEGWISVADRCDGITGCTTSAETTFAIPQDPSANNYDNFSRNFVMRGGTLTGATTPVIISGSYAGDSETVITVSFTVANSGSMCETKGNNTTCSTALWFGAHVAAQADWGIGLGAGSISGSPYHVALDAVDGAAVGQRDNQMQADAIANGRIVVIKDAQPNDAQDFQFNISDGASSSLNFTLDDDSNSTWPSSQTFEVAPGTWYVSEFNIPSSWGLTNISCVVTGTNGSTFSVDLGTDTATINLEPDDTVTCTFVDTKEPDKLDLSATKTASAAYIRTYTWNVTKVVEEPASVSIAEGGNATFNYTVSVTHDSGTASGWTVTGQIVVTNPNPYSVSGVSVSDAIDSNAMCNVTGGSSTIAANGSATFDYTCTYSQAPAATSQTNTATVTWTAFGSPNTSVQATAPVDWTAVTPSLVDESVTVTDTLGGNLGTVSYTDPNPKEFKYSKSFNGVGGTCTDYDNTAKIVTNDSATEDTASLTVEVCVGQDLTVTKTATASLTRTYKWLIAKKAEDTQIEIAEGGTAIFNYDVTITPNGYEDSAQTLGGTIIIVNPNDWQAVTVNVADTLDQGGTCTITEAAPYIVPESGSLTLHYTCTTDGTTAKNTVNVTWDKDTYHTPTGSATDDADVSFNMTEVNEIITVIDDKTDPGNPVNLGTWNWNDGPHTFEYALEKQGVAGECTNYTNTAVIEGTDQKASEIVTVCVGKDLTVTKTAIGSLSRTYLWKIDKSVNDTRIEIAEGGTATFNYSVKVTPDGFTDSGFTLGGTMTIVNPNKWQDVTVSVADTLDQGGSCTITEAAPYMVPKNDSLTLHYTCTTDGTSAKNTATITWDKAKYFTPSESASDDADVTFALGGETNKTITVVDDKTDPANPVTLGTWNWADGEKVFTYSLTKPGVAGECTDYTNTATIQQTGQFDSQKVTVCVGQDLTVAKTVTASLTRTYNWAIDKSAEDTLIEIAQGGTATFTYFIDLTTVDFTDSAFDIFGTITVTNPNKWQDVTLTSLTDTLTGSGTCSITEQPPVDGFVVPQSGSLTVHYTCTGESAATSINTAMATWDKAKFFTAGDTASDSEDVTFGVTSEINKSVTITDNNATPLDPSDDKTFGPWDFSDSSTRFSYTQVRAGVDGECKSYTNTAVIDQTNQSSSEIVTVCVGVDLTVSKTAIPSFTRTWTWDITKHFDGDYDLFAGDNATHGYKVTVTPISIDSLWKVVGEITVANPNAWDITVDISDAVDNGGICTVEGGGQDVMVPANNSITVNYECTYANPPTSVNGVNTATATWEKDLYHTPTGSDSGTAGFGFTTPTTEINPVITVDDDNLTDENWTVDRAVASWDYNKEFTCSSNPADYTDGTYSYSHINTATITETGDDDTATVNVTCYAPVVSKTAVPTWERYVDWTIVKVATPLSADAFAGDSAQFDYTVTLTKNVSEGNYKVTGVISVYNPHPTDDMTVDVSDAMSVLAGVVDCGSGATSLTVAAGQTGTCDYTLTPPDNTDGVNTATATFNDIAFTGSTNVDFGDPVLTGEPETITVDDTVEGDLGEFSDSSTVEYSQTQTCSSDPADYTNGVYSQDYPNTASINETTGDNSNASVRLNCYAPVVSKTAAGTYDERHDWNVTKTVDPESQNAFIGQTVSYEWAVTVAEMVVEENFAVTGVITVVNPAPMEMTVSLADVFDSIAVTITADADCNYDGATGLLTLPAEGTTTCGYSAAPADRTATLNTATATLNDIAFTASDPVEWTANVINPEVTVDDDQNETDFPANVTENGTWKYSEQYTCSTDTTLYAGDNTYTFGENNLATVKAGNTLLDSASASTEINCYAPTIEKTATATYDERHEWTLDKTVTPTSQDGFAGETKSYEWKIVVNEETFEESFLVEGIITVINPAPMAMTVDLSDALDDGTLATIGADADCNLADGELTVPANSTAACGYTTEPNNHDATANKATLMLNGVEFAATKAFTWDVNVIDGTAQLTDDQIGLNETLTEGGTFTESEEYTCSTDPADYTNGTYNFTEDNTASLAFDSERLTSTADTEVNCYIPTVSKTATPTFTRTFNWNITKDVDKTLVRQVGGSAMFNYTIVVTQTGFTDSLWKVTGKITVTNPNPSAAMSGVTVTDAVDNGGICTVMGGSNITIPAGGSAVLDYTCTYAAKPVPYSGVNTATVDWSGPDISNTASFAFDTGMAGNPTNISKTVTVTDTMTGFPTLTLGTVTGGTTTPFTTRTFTYSRTIAVPSFGCQSHTNTARIVETGQTAQKTVTVCGPMNVGGKTIGFWQNKNGQDIIKKAGAISGVCKLTPFLRQFVPFQDLSATASCTTVAAYVNNVIKAANASGASMNAMLKAQMLATALDVYFSDPALGGNKIGAPAPIGNVVIDLTYIKSNGGYQNVSSAFSGATSLTVKDMLTYAASQSNVGGSTWYGNVKSTQEMAKNAFDAINNNWVFPP